MSYGLYDVLRIYEGSDGKATTALYEELAKRGPRGELALNLFRAHKNSARAKQYRGGGYRGAAYDRKQWAMDNLVKILLEHGPTLGYQWGWGMDEKQAFHNVVLYVDIPTGQVSFHTRGRGDGPDYPGEWDGSVHESGTRICRWVTQLLAAPQPVVAA